MLVLSPLRHANSFLSRGCLRQPGAFTPFLAASWQHSACAHGEATKTVLAARSLASGAQHDGPPNECPLDYTLEDSEHRLKLEESLRAFSGADQAVVEVPIVIKGKEYTTSEARYQQAPYEHAVKVCKFYQASHELIQEACQAALEARSEWEHVPMESRLAIFEKAADLVSGKYRQELNAATMVGQAKTARQAEIDSACELADFLRFNAHYARELLKWQPNSPTEHEQNSARLRGLDGFVAAISPFNFTAIGGNLASAPALMGNCVVWKPSDTAMLSNYTVFKVLREAGLPDGVLNFVPSDGFDFGRLITGNQALAGVNFTGSVATFQWLWNEIGFNIKHYHSFPRLSGECGGKNFHLIHRSAHLDTAVAQTIRSAFEYSGQKCSACSRLYVAASIWPEMRDRLVSVAREQLKIGPATDFSAFTSAVIDAAAYKRITNYLNYARASPDEVSILCGAEASNEVGYFVQPTILETTNPRNLLMLEEIFGPVLTCYVYEDKDFEETLDLIDDHRFALTGSIFARDEQVVELAMRRLKMSAGNLYINDKSTGAVVGQQPFGGSRMSGTNDKAGGPHYLLRWSSQQIIKRTTKPMVDI